MSDLDCRVWAFSYVSLSLSEYWPRPCRHTSCKCLLFSSGYECMLFLFLLFICFLFCLDFFLFLFFFEINHHLRTTSMCQPVWWGTISNLACSQFSRRHLKLKHFQIICSTMWPLQYILWKGSWESWKVFWDSGRQWWVLKGKAFQIQGNRHWAERNKAGWYIWKLRFVAAGCVARPVIPPTLETLAGEWQIQCCLGYRVSSRLAWVV